MGISSFASGFPQSRSDSCAIGDYMSAMKKRNTQINEVAFSVRIDQDVLYGRPSITLPSQVEA